MLGIGDGRDIVKGLDEDEHQWVSIPLVEDSGMTRKRRIHLINETGLYHAIFKSRKSGEMFHKPWQDAVNFSGV